MLCQDPNGAIRRRRGTGGDFSASGGITTLGSGVDGSVRMLKTAYDTGGRPYLYTSYADTGGTTIVNQIQQVYNGLGQLITQYQSVSGAVNTSTTPKVQYAYSFVGTSGGPNHSRLVSMTYPNGRVLSDNYNSGVDDRLSRLSSISDSSATLEAYTYLGLNTVVTRSHPQTGVNQTYIISGGNTDGGDQYTGLDRFGRVVEQRWVNPNTSTVTDDFLYTYDRDGNRLSSSNALHSSLNQQFTYDNLNQLATFTQGSHTQSWGLDAVGNWLSFTNDGSTQTRSFNNQNQLTAISGATTPTYDNNGNTTKDDQSISYTLDAWNRIVKATNPAATMAYAYDALGRRVINTRGSNPAVDFYFSSAWQVLEEDQQGVLQRQFVWSSVYVDGLVEQDAGSSRWYAQQDANWNVTAMLNSNGSVADRFVYDPYGKGTMYDANWNLQGTLGGAIGSTWKYFFQGGRFDGITGLYNFRNRDYSTTLGRWMQQDPIGYDGGINLYQNEHGDPVDQTDPQGEGDTLNDGIRHCFALVGTEAQIECFKTLLQIAKTEGWDEIKIKAILKRLQRVAVCETIHQGYKLASAKAGGYATETDCSKLRAKCIALGFEVAGRKKYLSFRCDYYLPGSINAGSAQKEKKHRLELANKIVALTTCWARYKKICCP